MFGFKTAFYLPSVRLHFRIRAEGFKQKQNQVAAEGWEPTFSGHTDVNEKTPAMDGLRLAVFSRHGAGGEQTRIIATDMDPDSTAVSDHVVMNTKAIRPNMTAPYPSTGTSYTDALPVDAVSAFHGDEFGRLVADHAQLIAEARADGDTDDMLIHVYGVSPNALTIKPADDGSSMRITIDNQVAMSVPRDPTQPQ